MIRHTANNIISGSGTLNNLENFEKIDSAINMKFKSPKYKINLFIFIIFTP